MEDVLIKSFMTTRVYARSLRKFSAAPEAAPRRSIRVDKSAEIGSSGFLGNTEDNESGSGENDVGVQTSELQESATAPNEQDISDDSLRL